MHGRAIALIVALALALGCGWVARGWKERAAFRDYVAQQRDSENEALLAAIENAERWRKSYEELDEHFRGRLEDVALLAHRAADERVQQYAEEHLRSASEQAASSGQCAPLAAAAGVQAQLFGELDRLAEAYATEADSVRVNAQSCIAADGVSR